MLNPLSCMHLETYFSGDHLILKGRLDRLGIVLDSDLVAHDIDGDAFCHVN
jgi:hypothetical protein